MLLTAWFVSAALWTAPAVSAQDTSFSSIEYLSGSHTLAKKQKGSLMVTRTDIRLVDKKRTPYLIIPLGNIKKVVDTTLVPGKQGVKGAAKEKLLGKAGLGGLFGSSPQRQIILTTTDGTTQEVIVFKVHEEGDAGSKLAEKIRTQVGITAAVERAGGGTPQQNAPNAQAPADSANLAPPLMVVANPFVAAEADSEAAVKVGTAMRDEVKKFVGDKFQVVTREQMNAALEPYGYPPDAILSQQLAVTLAKALQAPILVAGDMTKETDGKYKVTASLSPVDGAGGTPVTVAQNDGESLTDFGRRVAEALKGPQPK